MKKFRFIFALCLLVLSTSSCLRHHLIYEFHPYFDLELSVDWSLFGSKPNGMTVMCYPKDGGDIKVQTTNFVDFTVINLKEGYYDIVVFNNTPEEFGNLEFEGLHSYDDFTIRAASADLPASTRATKGIIEPDIVGLGVINEYHVTAEMVSRTFELRAKAAKAQEVVSDPSSQITITPERIVSSAKIIINIDGIHNIRSCSGSIDGLADSYRLKTQSTGKERISQSLDSRWDKTPSPTDYTKGSYSTTIATFGLPSHEVINKEDVTLYLSFALVDNLTVVNYEFQVGDVIRKELIDGVLTFVIDLPPILQMPDVEPVADTGGGFDVDVADWGEEEEVVIDL